MANAANNSTLKIQNQTQNKFYSRYENNFLVLPNGKTVVGADYSNQEKLIMEDITKGNHKQVGTHGSSIYSVLFHSPTQSLLVGDYKGHVKQYKKVHPSFTIVRDYGHVGVGSVLSSTQVGGFAILGGNDNFLVAIDVSEQRVSGGLLKSPFIETFSLQVCEGVDSKVYLSVGGHLPEYSSDVSDFLNVTLLFNRNKKESPKVPEEMNQADALLEEKDEVINSLSLEIKQLKSSLQKQVHQNQGTGNQKKSETKTSP